ncbi:MAG: Sip1-related alpha-galactosidase, partial [Planctomycetota bacterium]
METKRTQEELSTSQESIHIDAGPIDLGVLIRSRDRFIVMADLSGVPDGRGVLQEQELILPDYRSSAYFAGAQRFGIDPERVTWPDGCNQLQPLVYERLADLKEGGLMVLAELSDGRCLCLLPIAGREAVSWFGSKPHDITLRVGTLGDAMYQGHADLLAVAVAECPAAAASNAWSIATRAPTVRGWLTLRQNKTFPRIFERLGWCSWEAFRADIDEGKLRETFRGIGRSDVPIKWAIIDDGWLDGLSTRHTDPRQCDDRALLSFTSNPDRFPDGLSSLVDSMHRAGIEDAGLWLNFNGYWEGLHATHQIRELDSHLFEVKPGVLLPRPSQESSRAFYDTMLLGARHAGFSFLKVDNQAKNLDFYASAVPNAAEASAENSASLEAVSAAGFDAMINCMAHNNVCAFSTVWSAVTRCSEDYLKGDPWRAKMH